MGGQTHGDGGTLESIHTSLGLEVYGADFIFHGIVAKFRRCLVEANNLNAIAPRRSYHDHFFSFCHSWDAASNLVDSRTSAKPRFHDVLIRPFDGYFSDGARRSMELYYPSEDVDSRSKPLIQKQEI